MSAIRPVLTTSLVWILLSGCPPPGHTMSTTSESSSSGAVDTCGHFCDMPAGVNQLAAGELHVCALLNTGSITCWGVDTTGCLGYADPSLSPIGDGEVPATIGRIRLGEPAALIRAGTYHNCAITGAGTVRCWGMGQYGALGYGNTEDIGDDEHPEVAGDVDIGGTAIDLALGTYHTCALLADKSVRCWGEGRRLGNGSPVNIGDDEPASASALVDLGGPAQQIAAGYFGTCAILEGGTLRCWGSTGGYPGTPDVESPAMIGDIDIGGEVVAIAAGQTEYCAILVDGSLRCWGENSHGQLGYGHTDEVGDDEAPASAGAVSVGGAPVVGVAPNTHTCAILSGGAVRCWGLANLGLLGVGYALNNVGDDELPTAIDPVDVGAPVTQLVTTAQSTCALTDAATVRCWGHGILGYGNSRIVGDNESPAKEGDVPVF